MAYLKGGTVVDGNLYVEGSLKVSRVTDASGSIVYLYDSDSAKSDRLVKFATSDGKIKYSYIDECTDKNNRLEYTFNTSEKNLGNEVNLYLNDKSILNVQMDNSTNPASIIYTLYEDGDSTKGKTFKLHNNSLTISYSPDQISLIDKDLNGLIEDSSGTIIIGDKKYRKSLETEVPDIFSYLG